jgi:histidyl-tRNA synthetase
MDVNIYRKMDFETLKGTKDSLPKDMIRINAALDVIKEQFEKFGFRPFDTPVIEYFETLAGKYDEDAEIVAEIFRLKDRGERELGLRYDLTVPLCRFVASQKQLKKPFRRYQVGKVFRDGPVKVGRDREFVQCDGDVVGQAGVEVEAELMVLFYETYKKLGIDAVIELNNNKILRGALLQNGFAEADLQSLILSIDKLKKVGMKGVLKEIGDKGLEIKDAEKAIKILESKSFGDIRKLAKNQELIDGIDEFEKLIKLIKPYVKFRINFSMSRGLNIYTGNIWEAYEAKGKISSSIGSGGRYDKVIGDYAGSGEIVPAVGISFGLVPILACLKSGNDREGVTDLLVVPLSEDVVPVCFEVASKFRDKMNVEIYYGYKIKQSFSYAEYLGAKEVAFIGAKDVGAGKFKIKNIATGKEREESLGVRS